MGVNAGFSLSGPDEQSRCAFFSKTKTRPTDLFKEQEISGFNYRTEGMAP